MTQQRSASKSEGSTEDIRAADRNKRVLKKYPNRRLYDTRTSSYITLVDVKKMVMAGEDFVVRDAKTSDDLTRAILLQIILEEEAGGAPMFSSQMLAQLIRFYGHAMQGMMGSYLEKNLQTFTDFQAKLSEQSKGMYDPGAMNTEVWTQFLNGQAPVVQNLMSSYLEQSKALFAQMQDQVTEQTKTFFPGMPGFKK
jgi:polyhydroxyalkanoate synthesis repressor PhaR